MKNDFKIAVCQMNVVDNKESNIKKAGSMIISASNNKSNIIILPEMFNCPYSNRKFPEYAEEIDSGVTVTAISELAHKKGVYIIAGSIPERVGNKIYNTSLMFDKTGKIIGKHRKIHLFDIDVSNKITFKESETISAGNKITLIDTDLCKLGIAICYDIRFPELFVMMTIKGAELIVVPAVFNMFTGPAHWELLMRTRAVDNQVYIAAASPARNKNSSYVAYANSMIVDPFGIITNRAGFKEQIIYSKLDYEKLRKTRTEMPLFKHRRNDVY